MGSNGKIDVDFWCLEEQPNLKIDRIPAFPIDALICLNDSLRKRKIRL
jgi:hypothetical protein